MTSRSRSPHRRRAEILSGRHYGSRRAGQLREGGAPASPDLRLRAASPFRRHVQGLQDKVKIVAIDLLDRPAWYKEKVYPENKVPALEHNNQVKGESLDLVKYIDSSFEGPSFLPDDPAKKQFAEELLAYTDEFSKPLYSTIRSKEDVSEETVAVLDKIEAALGKFSDGPFFLGQFSLVDVAYVPFIERYQIFFPALKNYDITKGRPNLQKYIEEVNKIDAYTQTKQDPQFLLEYTKKRFGIV